MKRKVTIAIADDHFATRKGLTQIIQEVSDFELVGVAQNGQELLDILCQNEVEIALLDIDMPLKTGWDVIQEINRLKMATKVIILSVSSEQDYAIQFYKAGAKGYLTKDSAEEELVEAIRKVWRGEKYVSAQFAAQLVDILDKGFELERHEKLSPREFQIFILIASGKTLSEISGELHLSIGTVSTYRSRILQKMELENNAQIVKYAYKNKLLS